MYPTSTKADAKDLGEGLKTLGSICSAVSIPVVAIGGVDAFNTGPVIKAGASGVAVVSAVFAAPDVRRATAELKAAVATARRPPPRMRPRCFVWTNFMSCRMPSGARVIGTPL